MLTKRGLKTSSLIEGNEGALEIRLHEPSSEPFATSGQEQKWVVICHPHPCFGGTMNNKVVTTLERAFQGLGYGTVMFNFRGVGESEGSYDGGEGEQQDLVSVVEMLRARFDVSQLVLAGFSFGGVIALKQASALKVDGLCVVSPAVEMQDVSGVEINQPWTLIQGGQDEVISAEGVLDWSMRQAVVPDVYWRAGSSHFYHRQLVWLKSVVALVY